MPIRKDFTISGIIFKNHTTYGSTYSTFTTADVHETNLTFRPHSQNDSKVAFYKRFHAIIALKRPWCHCPVSVCKVTQLIPSRSKSLPTPYQCYIPHLTFLFFICLASPHWSSSAIYKVLYKKYSCTKINLGIFTINTTSYVNALSHFFSLSLTSWTLSTNLSNVSFLTIIMSLQA